jgi:hypothetical protein
MIAFLPMWILGVPVVLALIDLMATRSSMGGADHDSTHGRYVGTHREVRRSDELRRGEESSPVVGQPATRNEVPVNIS